MADELEGAQGAQCCTIEVDFGQLSDLCAIMPRRLLVTGILVQWMRAHFTDVDNIENPLLHESLWTEDIATRGIAIDSALKYNPAMTEFRPGIFVKPGPWKIIRYGIADKKMFGTKMPPGHVTRYNSMCQGSHTLFCVAGESAEVEILATEVYKELMEFGESARKTFGFLRFAVTDVGEPAILEEATENFVVPVVVSYGAQDVWQICPPCCQELNAVRRNLWKTLDVEKTDTEG